MIENTKFQLSINSQMSSFARAFLIFDKTLLGEIPFTENEATYALKQFEEMGKVAGFSTDIYHKDKIEALKMGGLLAVNLGSIDPPTFSVMEWKPTDARNTKPIVLVGKGVVFDTGGLSLKPTKDSMDYMKCDMAGSAVVASVIY